MPSPAARYAVLRFVQLGNGPRNSSPSTGNAIDAFSGCAELIGRLDSPVMAIPATKANASRSRARERTVIVNGPERDDYFSRHALCQLRRRGDRRIDDYTCQLSQPINDTEDSCDGSRLRPAVAVNCL
jgi:hypothetical protein